MARHCRISEHGLGPRGGHHHRVRLVRRGVQHRVTQMPEVPVHGLVEDLVVGHRGLQVAVPVHQPVAAEDEAVAEHAEERPAHGTSTHRVHGKAQPVPVARAAHGLQLLQDALLVLVLPVPDALHQSVASHLQARLALQLEQAFLHDGLGGDACVVRPRLPQGVVTPHPVPAGEEVLHDVVHGVTHVQRAGDVGQRHHDHVGARVVVGQGGEAVFLHPAAIDFCLDAGGAVLLGEFARHGWWFLFPGAAGIPRRQWAGESRELFHSRPGWSQVARTWAPARQSCNVLLRIGRSRCIFTASPGI